MIKASHDNFSISLNILFVWLSYYICLLHIQYMDFLYCSYIEAFIDLIMVIWDRWVPVIVPNVN